MKKLLVVVLVFVLFTTTVGAESIKSDINPDYHKLTINIPIGGIHGTPAYINFWDKELTEDVLFKFFPGFERFDSIERVHVNFNGDKLLGIYIRIMYSVQTYAIVGIVGDFNTRHDFENEPLTSDILGIHVTAWGLPLWVFRNQLGARFNLDNIYYNIRVDETDENKEYSPFLEMLVNEIIRSSVIDGLEAELNAFVRATMFSTADAIEILRFVAGLENYVEKGIRALASADLNGDGKIDTADAVEVLRRVAGL
ncbi:MAG: hypothetical protein FWD48_00515 [Oscillospiraceae bacterium]|nr:hypothetical protein [Oscillospiraceae bacterium]